jgi:hypothetical protein
MCARGGTVQQLRVKAQLSQDAMQINFFARDQDGYESDVVDSPFYA